MTNGRVGSLLEVGTGFHPELTGRENIMLSAAIMGMRRSEVLSRFDEIVEFSGLAKFLDTPVKRYSSGMYMRLAFSVAAHLEPEILLVDEVLAVGDAEFQKKCLGRMEELGGTGRTVLFVSHSMPSVLRLCPRVILLDGGHLTADGTGSHVVEEYMGRGGGAAEREWPDARTAPGDERVRLKAVRVVNDERRTRAEDRHPRTRLRRDRLLEPLGRSRVSARAPTSTSSMRKGVLPVRQLGLRQRMDGDRHPRRRGLVRSRCRIPGNFFAEGGRVHLGRRHVPRADRVHALENGRGRFHVVDPSEGDGVRASWVGDFPGSCARCFEWDATEDGAV